MDKRIPKHVVAVYGSAHAFRAEKRKQVRAAIKAVDALRMGCAFFPCTERPVEAAALALENIRRSLTVKEWGK